MPQAFLVLDVNNDIVNAKGRGAAMGVPDQAATRGTAAKVKAAVAAARAAGDRVVWAYPGPKVSEAFGMPPSDAWGIEIDPDWGVPAADETVYVKTAIGAMTGTDMESDLKAMGVDTVLVCGVVTSYVVVSTAAEALERGFKVKVLEDCCSDMSDEGHAAAIAGLPEGVEVTESTTIWS